MENENPLPPDQEPPDADTAPEPATDPVEDPPAPSQAVLRSAIATVQAKVVQRKWVQAQLTKADQIYQALLREEA